MKSKMNFGRQQPIRVGFALAAIILSLAVVSNFVAMAVDPLHPFTYCSFPEDISKSRAIPPTNFTASDLTLTQVNLIHRHGIRTVSNESNNNCFLINKDNPYKWQCSLGDNYLSAKVIEVHTNTTTSSTPKPTTTAPNTTTSTPKPTTTAPNTTTSAPNTTTSAPNTTTSAPNTTTSAPNTTTSAPNTTTSAPNTTTSAPNTTTPGPNTTTPGPNTTTPGPNTTTPGSNTTRKAAGNPDFNPVRRGLFLDSLSPGSYISSDYLGVPFTTVFDVNPEFNLLGGTCQVGQLLLGAEDQFSAISELLYGVYFGSSNGAKPLFSYEDLRVNPDLLYMRSTNYQRTKGSLNLLMSSLLTSIYSGSKSGTTEAIPDDLMSANMFAVHIEDKNRDTMNSEETRCPDYDGQFDLMRNSSELKAVRDKYSALYGTLDKLTGKSISASGLSFTGVADCFASYVCTRKQEYLPHELQVSATSDTSALGVQLWLANQEENTVIANYNASKLSQCQMSNFFVDLLEGFNVDQTKYKTVKSDNYNEKSSKIASKSKLAVYSAHDSTIQGVLSSMGIFDGVWPSFASLINIEIYTDSKNNAYFRFIYNSKDLTNKIGSCSESKFFKQNGVCEFDSLLQHLAWVKTYPVTPYTPTPPASDNALMNLIYVLVGIILGVVIVIIGTGIYKWYQRTKQTSYTSV